MTITLLIGAAPYRLSEDAARWLTAAIRYRCTYDTGHARDIPARACLQLADVIAEDLERGVGNCRSKGSSSTSFRTPQRHSVTRT